MRNAIARALILSVLLAVPLVSGCQSEAKKHLYAAEDLFEKRDLDGAKKELEESIKDDPSLLDAHKSLAHIDEALGDQEGAAKEYMAASALDPTDQKLLDQARLYKQLEDLENSSGKALDDIKAGNVQQGIGTLKDILMTAKIPAARQKAVAALSDSIPIIEKIGDQQMTDKKYPDALATYEQGIRAAMMLSQGAQVGHARARRRPDDAEDFGCRQSGRHARRDLQAVQRRDRRLSRRQGRQHAAGGGLSQPRLRPTMTRPPTSKSAAARPTTRFANSATWPRSIARSERADAAQSTLAPAMS